jgi:hypothetical protein
MSAMKLAAGALVLASLPVPTQAQTSPVFDSWGSCNQYLNQQRKLAARGSDVNEATRWDAAYCLVTSFRQSSIGVQVVVYFPI